MTINQWRYPADFVLLADFHLLNRDMNWISIPLSYNCCYDKKLMLRISPVLYQIHTHFFYIKKIPFSPYERYVSLIEVNWEDLRFWGFLWSILTIPSTPFFWTKSSDVVSRISWSHSSSLGVMGSRAPYTTQTILAFTFHIHSISSFRPWNFSSFS